MKNLSEQIEQAKQVAKEHAEEIVIKTRQHITFPDQTIVQVYPKDKIVNLGFLVAIGKILEDQFPTIKAARKDKLLIEYWLPKAD